MAVRLNEAQLFESSFRSVMWSKWYVFMTGEKAVCQVYERPLCLENIGESIFFIK